MATYQATAPDGTVYQLEGPDDATDAQVAQVAAQYHASQQPEPPPVSALQSVNDKATNSAMFGLAPVAEGLGAGAANAVNSIWGANKYPDFGSAYDAAMMQKKAQLDQEGNDQPVASIAGNTVGFFGGAPASAVGQTTNVIKPLWQRALTNAGVGATIGGISGAGQTPGSAQDKLDGAENGAIVDGIVSGIAPGIFDGVGFVASPYLDAARAFTKSGQQDIAGRILNEHSPELTADAVPSYISQIGNADLAPNAPSTVADALTAAKSANNTNVNAAWAAAGLDNAAPAPTQPLKDAVGNYIGSLKKAEQQYVPASITDTLSSFYANEPIGEVQALRSDIGDQARAAYTSGENNKARVLNGLADVVQQHAENPELSGLTPDQTQAYQQARQATASFKQTFTQPKAVRGVLGVDSYGADKVPLSDTVDQFIKPMSQNGAPEALDSYLNAVQHAPADVQQQSADAIRGYMADKMANVTGASSLDQKANPTTVLPKVQKFISDYQHVINSPIFTDDQRAVFGQLNDAAAQAMQDKAKGTVSSYSRLSNGDLLGAMMGGMQSKVASSAVGGLVGSLAGHSTLGPMGAIVGAVEGAAHANSLVQKLYTAPAQKTMQIVQEALKDPALAAELRQKAYNMSENTISPKLAQLLGLHAGSGTASLADFYKNGTVRTGLPNQNPLAPFYQ